MTISKLPPEIRKERIKKISNGELPLCGPKCGLRLASRRIHAHDEECVYTDTEKE